MNERGFINGFISYCHVKPDRDMALFLEKYLKDEGFEVFLDSQILTGQNWPRVIEEKIQKADFFIVLLSEASIRSDMVRQEIRLAYDTCEHRGKDYGILPIRVAYIGKLPLDIGAYLDNYNYSYWEPDVSFTAVGEQIAAALRKTSPLSGEEDNKNGNLDTLFAATEAVGAPLPAADPRLVPTMELETGTVKLDSSFYVSRMVDDEMRLQVQKKGKTIIIKAPRQMGKSSLLARVYAFARSGDGNACYLDFQFFERAQLENLDTLFRSLAHHLARSLDSPSSPDDHWIGSLGAKANLTHFIETVFLKEAKSPILLLLDEVDRMFDCSFRDDFFSTFRYWHNRRSYEPCWENLNMVIAHSTEPYLWIRDIHQSPFNVGQKYELEDFEPRQVEWLNRRHNRPLKSDKEIFELMGLIGGQPFLVRLALYTLAAGKCSLSRLKKVSLDNKGPFGDHLMRFVWYLQRDKGLKTSLLEVLSHGYCNDEAHFLRLSAAGLVKGDTRNAVCMRCQLYEDYFRRHL